ncbi:MAG: hypothetical protein EBU85_07900 [Actinobacteria bacterium]|nr:hypothetical protein [Actinomycetota bacterium]
MLGAHAAVAAAAFQKTEQHGRYFPLRGIAAYVWTDLQDGMHRIPRLLRNDRIVQTFVHLIFVYDLTQIQAVVQDFIEGGCPWS